MVATLPKGKRSTMQSAPSIQRVPKDSVGSVLQGLNVLSTNDASTVYGWLHSHHEGNGQRELNNYLERFDTKVEYTGQEMYDLYLPSDNPGLSTDSAPKLGCKSIW